MTQLAIRILYVANGLPLTRFDVSHLEKRGIRLDSAETETEALTTWNPDRHDAILLHYDARLNGSHAFLRQWQRLDAPTPVVVLSSSPSAGTIVGAMKLGAADFVDSSEPDFVPRLVRVMERVQREQAQNGEDVEESVSAELDLLEKRNRNLVRLNAAGRHFASTLDSHAVMTQMLGVATNIIGAKDASVWAWETDERETLVCRATSNRELFESLSKYRLHRGQGIAGWVVANNESAIVGNTQIDDRFSSSIDERTGFSTESLLAVPLRVRDDVIGVLEILNKEHPFDGEDIALAETLADSAAIALENARLVEKLQSQTDELQARNEELDAFAHTVAHDLKTPLGWVTGYLELLIKDWERLSVDEKMEYSKAAQHGGQTMANIIDELLLLASLRRSEIMQETVRMDSVLRRATRRLEPMIRQYRAELISTMEFPLVKGYGPWIEGVWVNYLSNAVKYGGTPPRIDIGHTDCENGFVEFWVQDNGAGLTDEQQAQLFVPFSRLGQVRAHGHGLGLSIVRRIVEKLGGQVRVDSAKGRGSRFVFTLPKA